jgi:hypothetical protein
MVQVMYWISQASNRPQIAATLTNWFEAQKQSSIQGGLWMIHNYVKQADFDGNTSKLIDFAWPAIIDAVKAIAGTSETSPGSLTLLGQQYHIVGCSSPEYKCYPPFESRACSTHEDCNYEMSQLRWGLRTALNMTTRFGLQAQLQQQNVSTAWWTALLDSKLGWYPYDNTTGFRLDQNCAFECPHRHFSHLLQIFDLETVQYDASPFMGQLIHTSIDNWYRVTCNASNWFNEECRGFTQCGLASMNVVSDRPDAAVGNLTNYIETVVTPNGMYGEEVSSTARLCRFSGHAHARTHAHMHHRMYPFRSLSFSLLRWTHTHTLSLSLSLAQQAHARSLTRLQCTPRHNTGIPSAPERVQPSVRVRVLWCWCDQHYPPPHKSPIRDTAHLSRGCSPME